MTTYVVMGNAKYYDFLALTVTQIRRIAPFAPILVYDWGDDARRPGFHSSLPGLEVVDWTKRIGDLAALTAATPPARQVELAIAYNARFRRCLSQRLRKAVLKRWPSSRLARPLIAAGLAFENMLLQKVPCMQDASERIGAGRMIFLDADAIPVRPLEPAYDLAPFDVAVTLVERPNWEPHRCAVINSGVLLFGDRPAARAAILAAWRAAIERCDEWLREQTALTRLLATETPALFTPAAAGACDLGGEAVRVVALPCAEYNNTDRESALTRGARVIHLANTAHNLATVRNLLARLREAPASEDGGDGE